MQANLAWNKANKMVDKIQPYIHQGALCTLETEQKRLSEDRKKNLTSNNLPYR